MDSPNESKPVLMQSTVGPNTIVHGMNMLIQCEVGDYTYLTQGSVMVRARFGRFCSVGPDVRIGLFVHPSRDFVSTYPAFFSVNNAGCQRSFVTEAAFDELPEYTEIGHDVWVGTRVIIPGGVTIGTGAVLAAGAVVTKDVPPYAIVGGNPAKIIRYRFDEDDIRFLLESKWWELPEKTLRSIAPDFNDIKKLRARWKTIQKGRKAK